MVKGKECSGWILDNYVALAYLFGTTGVIIRYGQAKGTEFVLDQAVLRGPGENYILRRRAGELF